MKAQTLANILGIVCANIVLGVNVISDIKASFSVFFGGQSSTYEVKLEKIYEEVYRQSRDKAEGLKANAILKL